MKLFHGSKYKFNTLKKNSWVTPYKDDAAIFAVPWSSDELINSNENENGRPPKKLKFKQIIPEDHPIYIYELNTNNFKNAKTNTGKSYDWNKQITEDTKVKLIKKYNSWQDKFLIKKSNYTKEEVKSIKKEELLKIIEKGRQFVKKHPVVIKKFKEYKTDINEIDYVPIIFDDLDVSAKTEHGIILLNYELLCDGNFVTDYGYLAHELVHYLQQTVKPNGTEPEDDYLKNPDEQEGFNTQIKFIEHEYGEDEANQYVEHLLDHHDVNDADKDKIKKELTAAIKLIVK